MLTTHGRSYVKINRAYLKVFGFRLSVCPRVCGKYIAWPVYASLTSGLSLSTLLDKAIAYVPTTAGSGTLLKATQFKGQPAWSVHGVGGYTVYMARTGKPYLLGLTASNGRSIRFSEWNTATVPGPPPASLIVTPSQL